MFYILALNAVLPLCLVGHRFPCLLLAGWFPQITKGTEFSPQNCNIMRNSEHGANNYDLFHHICMSPDSPVSHMKIWPLC